MSNQLSLEELKRRFPIQDLWRKAGCPEPRKWSECSNPWREDKKRSFSVREDGMLYNDFSEGGGDNVRFWAVTRGITDGEAIKEFRQMAGGENHLALQPLPRPRKESEKREVTFPSDLRHLKHSEYQPYADSRKIDDKALFALSRIDGDETELYTKIQFTSYKGQPSLLFTERWDDVVNTACRRLDNQPYQTGRGGVKELCLTGSTRSLPLGNSFLEEKPEASIMLCEGTPDYLTAWHLILKLKRKGEPLPCVPIGMLGASNSIHPITLELLAGRRVSIYPHIDPRGQGATATQKWGDTLYQLGCDVDVFDFTPYRQADGKPVTDLNELLFMSPADKRTLTDILPL